MNYIDDFPLGATVQFFWNTNGQDGASITRGTDGTLKVYKDAGVTERTSLAGITQVEDFDGNTGVHTITVDTNDNTDAGFYASGHEYHLVMVGAVIDTKTVNAEVGHFSIERAGGVLSLLKHANYGLAQLVRATTPANTVGVDASGRVDVGKVGGTAQTPADLAAEIATRAPGSTALSSAVWTAAKAAFLDEALSSLDDLIVAQVGSVLAAVGALPTPGDATAAAQVLIRSDLAALFAALGGQLLEGDLTRDQLLRLMFASLCCSWDPAAGNGFVFFGEDGTTQRLVGTADDTGRTITMRNGA